MRAIKTLEKVAICGAAGGIGQPLALQLKQFLEIKKLSLYDVVPMTKGVGLDLHHCSTPTKVEAFAGDDQLPQALTGASIVVIPAGVPRKPGMSRDDLFNTNAKIVASLIKAAAKACPEAMVLLVTNPINSTVPIAATIRNRLGLSNNKLLGVTTLDVIRTSVIVSEHVKRDVRNVKLPVIGGHAGITIIPVLSQLPGMKWTRNVQESLTKKIAMAGDEVVKAKAGAGSATLAMAFAAAEITKSVIRGLNGEKDVQECAFVESQLKKEVPFFASLVQLGPTGYKKPSLPKLNEFESEMLKIALPQLIQEVAKGIKFGEEYKL